MNPVFLILALIESVAAVGGFILLIQNVAGDCVALYSLIGCVLLVVGSILAASSWVKTFNIDVTKFAK